MSTYVHTFCCLEWNSDVYILTVGNLDVDKKPCNRFSYCKKCTDQNDGLNINALFETRHVSLCGHLIANIWGWRQLASNVTLSRAGWPDRANFCLLGDCLYWQGFLKSRSSPIIVFNIFMLTNMVWDTFRGIFFRKIIWSPCLKLYSVSVRPWNALKCPNKDQRSFYSQIDFEKAKFGHSEKTQVELLSRSRGQTNRGSTLWSRFSAIFTNFSRKKNFGGFHQF
jgi:hypothetical protein